MPACHSGVGSWAGTVGGPGAMPGFKLCARTTGAAAMEWVEGRERIGITVPHLRHFIFTVRPATFSSAIWYLAEHWGQENFIRIRGVSKGDSSVRCYELLNQQEVGNTTH